MIRLYIILILNLFILSEKNIFSDNDPSPRKNPPRGEKELHTLARASEEETKEEERLSESTRKKQSGKTEHELLEHYPRYLYHATGSLFLFEIDRHGGTPKGPAFFSTVPTRRLYIDLYHRKKINLAREIRYVLTRKPKLAKLKSLAEEKVWVEEKLGIRIPKVLSGRGSIIDRFPEYKERICTLYQSFGYDALIDEAHGTLVFFAPEKFLKAYSVEALGFSLKNQLTQKVIIKENYEEVKLYDILIFIWSFIKLCGLTIYEEDQETLSSEGKKILKMIRQIVRQDPLSPLGFDQFKLPLFPLALNFFSTQKEGYIKEREELESEIFAEEGNFSWIRENYWNIRPLMQNFLTEFEQS